MLRKILLCLTFLSPTASLLAKTFELGGDRPAKLITPFGYKDSKSYPLVVLLHGVRTTAEQTDLWLGLTRVNDRANFLLLMPNGSKDSTGNRFWNATTECCDDENSGVDDASYLADIISEAKSRFAVDPARVYVIGHSNGGYMAYTLACSYPELVRGVVSIAGSTFVNAAECKNPQPLNILQIHGDQDSTVPFDGNGRSPGAIATTQRWVDINQCQSKTEAADALDLVRVKWELGVNSQGQPGLNGDFLDFVTLDFKKETDTTVWSNCTGDSKVGLWKVKGSNHVPSFFGQSVIEKALEFVH